MNADKLKKLYGEEYPAALVSDGIRIPLSRECRFSRTYESKESKMGVWVSRFMDGSALITASEFQQEWPAWTEDQRMDFCNNCCWLDQQSDFPEMLRFIMNHGAPTDWSAIALSVASQLPRDEAFHLLLGALQRMEIGKSSNIAQGIALTKHPDAETTLRHHLQGVWAHQMMWDHDDFLNWVAYDARTCISHLLELGAPASDFEEQVRKLSQHVCPGNRDSCRNFLSKHYTGLKQDPASA
jgi:hypothetical protein